MSSNIQELTISKIIKKTLLTYSSAAPTNTLTFNNNLQKPDNLKDS